MPAQRRGPCRTMTPATRASCGCSKARRCGRSASATVGRSCADCHGAASVAMRGVAARYPRYDARLGRPITLTQRIEQCRIERQARAVAATGERRVARPDRLCRAAIARHAGAGRDRRSGAAVLRSGQGAVHHAARPAQPVLQPVPRRAGRPAPRRQRDPAGPPQRLPGISAGMAGHGFARPPSSATAWWACVPSRSRRIPKN